MIKSLSCLGFRGFSHKQTLELATPNGEPGSGLTVLVGPNGGGKSTLVECFNMISLSDKKASFSKGKRNVLAGDSVEIVISSSDGQGVLKTIKGGSETKWNGPKIPKIYYLPSRRFYNPFFGMYKMSREQYVEHPTTFNTRTASLDSYTYRLIDLCKDDSTQFDSMLSRILGNHLEWTIDQEDNGQYYVKITKPHNQQHNSDGMGEGILSLMFIVDALCSNNNVLTVIDEPELSLHPQLQLRLLHEILEKTRESQIVIATHSPNMLSIESICNGGVVARVFDSDEGTQVCPIDELSRSFIQSTSHNINNPHILGTDARACFFAEDGLIITEGQEDVVLYPIIMNNLNLSYAIPFFGFGAGGASDIVKIAHILKSLGFKKVGAIYDGDMKSEFDKFNDEFSTLGYRAWIIPADDIRDKTDTTPPKKGLLDKERKTLKDEYSVPLNIMFKEMDSFLNS